LASGGPEFIQAIQETGLMEKVKEIILKAGTVEKEIVSELRFLEAWTITKEKAFLQRSYAIG